MNRRDRGLGQLELRIEVGDRLVVPFGDIAKVDVSQDRASQLQLVWLDAWQVDDDINAADHCRELHQLVFCELVRLHRHVGRAEINGAVVDLVDAGAGPYSLIIQLDACRAARSFTPLRVNRCGETGPRAGDLLRLCGDADAGQAKGHDRHDEFHTVASSGAFGPRGRTLGR